MINTITKVVRSSYSSERAMRVSSIVFLDSLVMPIEVACILGIAYCIIFSAMANRSFGSNAWKSVSINPEF